MSWFYEFNGEQKGPVTESELDQLIAQGSVLPTTLVWREGLSSWTPLAEARPSGPPPMPGAGTTRCDSCGGIFPSSDVVPIAGRNICASCKPAVLQNLQQGGVNAQVGDPARTGPAWEMRETLGTFPAIRDTVKAVLTEPNRTFATMRLTGGLGNPFLYNLICASIGGLAVSLYLGGMQTRFMAYYALRTGGPNPLSGAPGIIFQIIWTFIAVALGIFVQSAVIHVCLMICGGARRPFEATFRALCYGPGSVALLNVIPFVGSIAAFFWGMYVICVALEKTHETDMWRVIVALSIPLLVCCVLFVGFFMLIFGFVNAQHMH